MHSCMEQPWMGSTAFGAWEQTQANCCPSSSPRLSTSLYLSQLVAMGAATK